MKRTAAFFAVLFIAIILMVHYNGGNYPHSQGPYPRNKDIRLSSSQHRSAGRSRICLLTSNRIGDNIDNKNDFPQHCQYQSVFRQQPINLPGCPGDLAAFCSYHLSIIFCCILILLCQRRKYYLPPAPSLKGRGF